MKKTIISLLMITIASLMWGVSAIAKSNPVVNGGISAAEPTIDAEGKQKVYAKISEVFNACCTPYDLIDSQETIKKLDRSIKEVRVIDGTLYVTFEWNSRPKAWINPLFYPRNFIEKVYGLEENLKKKKSNGITVWIGDALLTQDNRSEMLKNLAQQLRLRGYDVIYTTVWNDYYAFNSDIVLFAGHGVYVEGEGHYLNTGVPYHKEWWYSDMAFRPSGMRGDCDHAGTKYIAISEEYIRNKKKNLNPNSVVFLATCHNMEENEIMADVFLEKGAAAMIGYSGTSYQAPIYGAAFVDMLSDNKTIGESFAFLHNNLTNDNINDVLDFYGGDSVWETINSLWVKWNGKDDLRIKYNKNVNHPESLFYGSGSETSKERTAPTIIGTWTCSAKEFSKDDNANGTVSLKFNEDSSVDMIMNLKMERQNPVLVMGVRMTIKGSYVENDGVIKFDFVGKTPKLEVTTLYLDEETEKQLARSGMSKEMLKKNAEQQMNGSSFDSVAREIQNKKTIIKELTKEKLVLLMDGESLTFSAD